MLAGDGQGVGQLVRGLAQDLEGAPGRVVGVDAADHADNAVTHLRKLVNEGDAHAKGV
ncbi:hypothetical protein D3C76_1743590 [compost metagenome]